MDKDAWIFFFIAVVLTGILTIALLYLVVPEERLPSTDPQPVAQNIPPRTAEGLTINILYHAMRNGFVGSDEANAILLALIRQLETQMDSMTVQTPYDRLALKQEILQEAREK